MRRFIRADITTAPMASKINYPNGWYENDFKIIVRIYDDENRKCLAEFDDDALFAQMMATGRVEELTESEMNVEIARLRPPPVEVKVILRGEGKNHKEDIEAFIKAKGLKYRVEER